MATQIKMTVMYGAALLLFGADVANGKADPFERLVGGEELIGVERLARAIAFVAKAHPLATHVLRSRCQS
jgi:hypothetical protein